MQRRQNTVSVIFSLQLIQDIHKLCFFIALLFASFTAMSSASQVPLVINTWAFVNATAKAWDVLMQDSKTALDAVETGCSQCEIEQCDYTVGFGGSPDEDGETTLDAMIMDGKTHDVGAVAALRRIKNAIAVARMVLHHTNHSLLVGDQATKFAISMGFKEESLSSPHSLNMWEDWKKNQCQPNFWKNVVPNPEEYCGPYKPINAVSQQSINSDRYHRLNFGPKNHDTIGMVAIDKNGDIASGTSSNGAKFKIPGRVGDSPIPGAGSYADNSVGGAAATGDGDVMMRFLPSYNTVENMRRGMNPFKAAEESILRIAKMYPSFSGGIVATSINGDIGAACHGMKEFPFSVASIQHRNVTVQTVQCISL